MKDIKQLEEKLNHHFHNQNLILEAITHRSFLNENKDWPTPPNERLEFLGDSILGFLTAEYLFKNYSNFSEGKLTSIRAALVNTDSLLSVAHELGLEHFILTSKGEAKDLKTNRSYVLANAIEAIIGALYLDGGVEKAKQFVEKYIFPKTEEIIKKAAYKDNKSLFQEKSQEIYGITPTYKTLKSWGPDHEKQFEVGVYLGEELIATAKGYSKQEAELEAAKKALIKKGWVQNNN
jgi:ribonuclease-3